MELSHVGPLVLVESMCVSLSTAAFFSLKREGLCMNAGVN